ncbi:MAG: succinate dehydrogenase assembly factor 2 [Gammaproteobacteria bacterium]
MTTTKPDRVYWSCRRGMLELDLILIPFFQNRYPLLPEDTQLLFITLLECTDMELYAWLTGRSEPEQDNLQTIVKLIRDYAIDPSRPRPL